MRAREIIAFLCFLVSGILGAGMGLFYLFSTRFTPYHAAAIGTSWERLTPSQQVFFIAALKSIGGGFLASATAFLILLFIPYRAKADWARWALLVVGLMVSVPALYAALIIRWGTPASFPWYGIALGIVLILAGFLLYKPVAPAAVSQESREADDP